MEKAIVNEFGERIPVETLYGLADRIRTLTDKELDELWLESGFIFSEREPGFKAISKDSISRIRGGIWCSMSAVESLLLETRLDDVEKSLLAIEKRSGYR